MRVRGEVFSGVLRGTPLVEKYFPRLIGLLGFRPFLGTVDVRLERNVDISAFAAKTIEHVLRDGRRKVDAYLAPVRIKKLTSVYSLMQVREEEKQILARLKKLEETAKKKLAVESEHVEEPAYDCWAAQFRNGIYKNDVAELISKDMIKERLGIGDGDTIEIEFFEANKKKKPKV